MSANSAFEKLSELGRRLEAIEHAQSMLGVDEAVMMPTGGGEKRAESMSILAGMYHEMATAPEVGDWLAAAQEEPLDDMQQAAIREQQRTYTNMTCLSGDFVRKQVVARMRSEQLWRELRAKDDWAGFLPAFEGVVAVAREEAELRAKALGLDPYDAMAGDTDFGPLSFGVTYWDENTREFNLDNEKVAESLNIMGEFFRVAGPDQFAGMRQVEGNGGWGASYNAGIQTMIIEGYWHPGETQIQKPEIAQHNRASWAPVSDDRKDVKIQAVNAHFVQIFKEGKNQMGAFKLGEFFNTAPALDIIFKEVGWMHGITDWVKTVDANAYPGLKFYIDSANEATEWHLLRRCPIHWFVRDQMIALREQVYRDLMKPAEAAAELQKRALAEWEAQGLQ